MVLGKGPSLNAWRPFSGRWADRVTIGLNNVHRLVPDTDFCVLWHRDVYAADAELLERQQDFTLVYSREPHLVHGIPNALEVPYAGAFPPLDTVGASTACWDDVASGWMWQATFITAVRLAWWLGAAEIDLIGFDFSHATGCTADDAVLDIPVRRDEHLLDQVLRRQQACYEHLRVGLARRGVTLERRHRPQAQEE